ncbi:hypothetical protein K6H11_002042 [Candida tropicalis]
MTTKLFPSNSLLLLGPIFLITTDFVITRFSQTGGPKKLANNTKQHASNSIMIFGIAALAGGFLVYKNKDSTEKPLFASKYFDEITTGERSHLRDESYDRKYKVGFLKTFDRDNSGLGEQLKKTGSVYELPNYNLIPAHSPFGYQFGAGIRTQELGPRRERERRF